MGNNYLCEECIWNDKCSEVRVMECNDFTPPDDRLEVQDYLDDLAYREMEYGWVVKQFD